MHIRVDDIVEVITGDDRNARGKVLRVLREDAKLVVEGVNRVYRHVKRGPKNLQGGRLSKEMPVSLSNVMLVCPKCDKPSRTGARLTAEKTKERYCKKCDAGIGLIAPARVKKQSTGKPAVAGKK